jgi:hypothetical protein
MVAFSRAVALVVWFGAGLSGLACGPRENEPAVTEERRAMSLASESSDLLGFALEDALPDETASAILAWGQPPDGVEFTPSESSTRLEWTLELPNQTSELYRIEEVDVHCDKERVFTNTNMCDDRLEATLILRLETEDGALAEEVPVEFEAFSPSEAYWKHTDVSFEDFAGSFEISANVGEPGSLQLGLFGTITDRAAEGSLLGDLITEQKKTGRIETAGGVVFTVAQWRTE